MTGNRQIIEKWTAEYAKGGIPSSVRETPSGAVKWAVKQLKDLGFPLRSALDAGCGKGRNSLYMAEQGLHVTAFDFTPDAVERLQTIASELNLTPRIRAAVHDLTTDWAVPTESMDLIIDAFCFKHIIAREGRVAYRAHMLRSLRPGGHYMVSFAGTGDGYYGEHVIDGKGGDEQVALDPAIGVESMLYTRDAMARFFGPELTVFAELHSDKPSVMHGKEYKRETYALLMKRNPHRV